MRKTTILTIALALACTMRASAFDDYNWTGATDTRWNWPGNWTNLDFNGGTPNNAGDTATIKPVANDPHVNVNVTVGSVTIEDQINVFIDSGRQLTIASTDGLTIGNQAFVDIEGGTLKLTGGGEIAITSLGGITFSSADGTIRFGGDRPYYIATGPAPSPDPRNVIFTAGEETVVGTLVADSGSNPTFILQPNNAITGVFTIGVRMVNNGWVEADRGGAITLDCFPKSGTGAWRIVNPNATIVVDVPVTGGECSTLLVKQGTLYVNEHWISCGDLVMDLNGGKIDVAAKVLFKTGTCAQACDCAPVGP